MIRSTFAALLVAVAAWLAGAGALAQCPPTVPVEGATPPGPLPVFPSSN